MLTVYGDVTAPTGPLSISDRRTICVLVLVLDDRGIVRWSGSAGFAPGAAGEVAALDLA